MSEKVRGPSTLLGMTVGKSFAAVAATGAGGFVDDDFAKAGQLGRKFFPEPAGHEFDGRIFEAGDVVEAGVVELFDEGPHGVGDRGVIVENSGRLIDGAAHGNGDFEAVAMEVAALVTGGELGEGLGRLKLEVFGEGDDHGEVLCEKLVRVASKDFLVLFCNQKEFGSILVAKQRLSM